MQYFSGLVSLRAINILHFRNSDTCIWVMRELLRFMIDNLSHTDLKLEWIALEDDRVHRVIRSNTEDGWRDDVAKGKATAHESSSGNSHSAQYPTLSTEGLDSDSESDDDERENGTRLKCKTVGPLPFYDVFGVKIFEKEIRSGRL